MRVRRGARENRERKAVRGDSRFCDHPADSSIHDDEFDAESDAGKGEGYFGERKEKKKQKKKKRVGKKYAKTKGRTNTKKLRSTRFDFPRSLSGEFDIIR